MIWFDVWIKVNSIISFQPKEFFVWPLSLSIFYFSVWTKVTLLLNFCPSYENLKFCFGGKEPIKFFGRFLDTAYFTNAIFLFHQRYSWRIEKGKIQLLGLVWLNNLFFFQGEGLLVYQKCIILSLNYHRVSDHL